MLEGSKIQKYRISKLLSNSDYICHDENLCSYLLVEDKVEVKNKDLSFLNNGNTIRNIDKVYIE